MAETFYTVKAAAAYLGVSTWFIYQEIKAGRLAYIPVGTRSFRVTQTALDEYVAANTRVGI